MITGSVVMQSEDTSFKMYAFEYILFSSSPEKKAKNSIPNDHVYLMLTRQVFFLIHKKNPVIFRWKSMNFLTTCFSSYAFLKQFSREKEG